MIITEHEEPEGRVLKLKELVSSQKDTVASRMIISKNTESITLFSFDRGEGLSEHTAPYDAVVTILECESEIQVAGESYNVKEGSQSSFLQTSPILYFLSNIFQLLC